MIIKNAELETVCGPTSTLPVNTLPEFAFAGRSNVGKSSLINGIMQRKSLARTSGKPGKTQTINFYKIRCAPESDKKSEFDFYLVDLPGYGYAKRSKEESAKWGPMTEKYLKRSAQLKMLFVLADIRHEAMESDLQMLDYARYMKIPVTVIGTKADKLSKNELARQTALLKKGLELRDDEKLIPWSAVTRYGIEDIYYTITGEQKNAD